ncbi:MULTISPECIES: extracellular solute-binding protein [Grimontia]|uniref:Putative ABC transporter-binding protein n=1 Tax=Grimontia marina TaxID=646534 RepID=A0A128F4F0_9GAMM|nr:MULTISPECIES: extracellular solute-binding protein [Grimontia]WRV99027.1 extracellular solute-binding protein [Grimontia sp. NTOU-MAR1]CZF81274.1 putative ABC transporter-binding protein precursor [Grimontia marina]
MFKLTTLAALSALAFTAQAAELPANLNWQTNWDDPVFASDKAKRGGTLRTHLSSFPLTLRSVGPDSNSGLRGYFLDEVPGLVTRHPDTLNWIPAIATDWAYAGDNKTIYFKLNPKAKWNDGKPLTADDFVFMLQFYRSKDIVAPWYNDYYTKTIANVVKIDDHTIAASTVDEKNPEELMRTVGGLVPRPQHFYASGKDKNGDGVDDNFVRKYNFKPEPSTGPYFVDDIKKGKSVTFKHVGEDWWGYDNRYYQNRYNVDKIRMTVIRDTDVSRQHFEKGKLDIYDLTLPEIWHEKTDGDAYKKGYIQKFWGFNETPQGGGGLWLNTAMPILDNINVRRGIMHATDFDGLIEKLIRGDYQRKPHAMGSGHGEYSWPDAKAPDFNIDKATEYFIKAGFDKIGSDGIRVNDKGERLSFELVYPLAFFTPRMAYLKEQSKLAGLEFSLKLIDGATGFKYVSEKKHQIAFINMGASETPGYWQYFHSDNANKPQTNNFTNFSTPELDKLIEQYRVEFDISKKHQQSKEMQRIIQEAAVVSPSYIVPWTRQGHWRWVKYPENPMQKWTDTLFTIGGAMGYSTFWLDADVKKETLDAMDDDKTFEPVTVIDDRYK